MEEKYCNYATARSIADQIRESCSVPPRIGFVLGSGWGGVADALRNARKIPYAELRGMPRCGVEGHAGNFVLGELDGVQVVLQQGRIHMYEGHTAREAVLPVAVMRELGADRLILTNAAGGISSSFSVGDLMVLTDHMNFTGRNPLDGATPSNEYPVFADMTHVYDAAMSDALFCAGDGCGVKVHGGVYMQVLGPTFETPAEIRAYARLGADAVGMSTAIEAVYARYLKMRVAAVSCITNPAAGLSSGAIEHADVIAQSQKREKIFSAFLKRAASLCANV